MPEEKKVYSVSAVNRIIASMFADEDLFSSIAVSGEVSNLTYHRSGHIYFSIKDEKSVLPAVMFRSSVTSGLKFKMQAGDKVVVTGSVGVYEEGGKYQLYARRIERAGTGDLYIRYEELKKKLEEEGMFDPAYKQPIPPFGQNIGVVTSPTGAVIEDIIKNAKRRNPHVSITLFPVKVQGEGAAEEIAEAIARMDALGFDTLIVGRGGGSLEDLWPFNEEIVARQIFASKTPIISAVGHETDFALSDFVADARASTPTAAAELAVFSYSEFENNRKGLSDRMNHAMYLKTERIHREMERDTGMLARLSPEARVRELVQRLSDKTDSLDLAMNRKMEAAKKALPEKALLDETMSRRLSALKQGFPRRASFDSAMESCLTRTLVAVRMRTKSPGELMEKKLLSRKADIAKAAAVLDGLSPLRTLAAGYSYISDADGHNVKEAASLSAGDVLSIRFADGEAKAEVLETHSGDEKS